MTEAWAGSEVTIIELVGSNEDMADRFEPTEFWSWGLKPLGRDLRLETGPIVLRSRYQMLDL